MGAIVDAMSTFAARPVAARPVSAQGGDRLAAGALVLTIVLWARRKTDALWPKPMWGALPPKAYGPDEIERVAAALGGAIGLK